MRTYPAISLILCRGVIPGEIPIVVLSLTSSFCASASFAMLWMWTSELMPTYVRNAGVGSCSLVARIGGVTNLITSQNIFRLTFPDSSHHSEQHGRVAHTASHRTVHHICPAECHYIPFSSRDPWGCHA